MKKILSVLLSVWLLAGCAAQTGPDGGSSGPENPQPPESATSVAEELPEEEELESQAEDTPEPATIPLSPLREDPGDLDLTRMQEDYDSLWLAMERSYPFLGVARRSGIEVDEIRERYRGNLAEVKGLAAFARHLKAMVDEFRFIGHFEFLVADNYLDYCRIYSDGDGGHSGVLGRRLREERTVVAYRQLAEAAGLPFDLGSGMSEGHFAGMGTPNGNLRTEILDGGVAYMAIRSFGYRYMQADFEALPDFYRDAAGCEHLIIDLTENGGGSDNYWRDGIVAPNITAPLTGRQYMLLNSAAPENREYWAAISQYQDSQPIRELPQLPALIPEDRDIMDRFVLSEMTVAPWEDGPLFGGKIWVLVSPTVYSASESFALFCKGTGFATLVGKGTGGDGGGWDPGFVVLPHSGLLARYSMFYTLNPDGSSNEEFGTQPDISSEPGETALETCLRVIREGNN